MKGIDLLIVFFQILKRQQKLQKKPLTKLQKNMGFFVRFGLVWFFVRVVSFTVQSVFLFNLFREHQEKKNNFNNYNFMFNPSYFLSHLFLF